MAKSGPNKMKKWRKEARKSNLEQGRKHTGRAYRTAGLMMPKLFPDFIRQMVSMKDTITADMNQDQDIKGEVNAAE